MAIPIHSQTKGYQSSSGNGLVIKSKKLKISNQNPNQTMIQGYHSNQKQQAQVQNIKEVLNTSAPLCISSYASGHPPSSSHSKRNQAYSGTTISRLSKNMQNGVQVPQTAVGQSRARIQTKQSLNMTTVLNQNNSQEDIIVGTMNTTLHQDRIPHNHNTHQKLQQYRPQSNAAVNRNQNLIFYSAKQSCKYQEQEGFMRGARIADKIQEFYTLNKNAAKGAQTQANQSVAFQISKQLNQGIQQQGYQHRQRAVSSYGNSRRVPLTYQNKQVSQNLIQNFKDQQQLPSNSEYNRTSSQGPAPRHPSSSQQRQKSSSAANRTQNLTMMIEENTNGGILNSNKDYDFYNTKIASSGAQDTMKLSDIIQSQDQQQFSGTLSNQQQQRNVFSNQNLPTDELTQVPVGEQQVSSNEIRKIKLNYIQLNKRAGTSYAAKRGVTTIEREGNGLQTQQLDQQAKNEYSNAHQIVRQQDLTIKYPGTNNEMADKLFYNDAKDTDPKTLQYQKENAQNLDSELYDMQFCTENSSADNLDNYIIGKRIGQGAYAVVRIGLHKSSNQKIACKIYEKFKLLEPNRRKSVKREIKIMERLDHVNIAKLYEAFDTHKQVFLIMEFVSGGSLHGYLKSKQNRQMHEVEAKYLFKQVLSALYFCHQRNVTHRDIKLENILLNEEKTKVKLIDFGFSTCIPNDRKVKLFCGTPSYMAPEIVSKKEYAGPPADIWAIGVLFFALLCGKFPFRGQNDKELYKKICKYDLEVPEHVSSGAKAFLNKILRKDPDQRPSSKSILMDPFMIHIDKEYEAMFFPSLSLKQPSSFATSVRTVSQQPQTNFNQTQEISKLASSQLLSHSGSQERHQITADMLKQLIKDSNKHRQTTIQNKEITQFSSINQSLEQTKTDLNAKKNRINMEAYQAYYNTSGDQQQHQNTTTSNPILHQNGYSNNFANESFPMSNATAATNSSAQQNMNIINNIMHINHQAGASATTNINIITQPNTQNNFIFNNTVPIKLNFYKSGTDAQGTGTASKSDDPVILDLNNFDPEILKELQKKYSYNEQELLKGLADTQSRISIMYQKLIDQKLMTQAMSKTKDNIDLQSLEGSIHPLPLQTGASQRRLTVEQEKERAASLSMGRVAQTRQQMIGVQQQQMIEDFNFSDSFEVDNNKKKLNQTTFK